MKIRNLNVGNVILASGVGNFHGEGYPYHKYLFFFFLFAPITVPICWLITMNKKLMNYIKSKNENIYQFISQSNEMSLKPFLFNFRGTVLSTKTIPLNPQKGNMEMKKDGITPKHFFPDCIHVNMFLQIAVNAVALTSPGLPALLKLGRLQKIKGVFFLSTMPLKPTKEERVEEIKNIAYLICKDMQKNNWLGTPIIQLNISCPNTGHGLDEYLNEVRGWLGIFADLGFTTSIKINVLTPISAAIDLMQYCDALFVSNTYPVDKLTSGERAEIFYWGKLPLTEFQSKFHVKSNGGVSGRFLFEKVYEYVRELKKLGVTKPIILGGGILSKREVILAKDAGADGISPGSVTMIAPWKLREVINAGNKLFPM